MIKETRVKKSCMDLLRQTFGMEVKAFQQTEAGGES
jgi:hypothetical protein